MPSTPDGHHGGPSPLRQIDLAADRFEQEWRQGRRPLIAPFLDQVPAGLRLRLLAELVCVDLEHRLRGREAVTLDDYFRQFPELGGLAPGDRADLERHARQRLDQFGRTAAPGSPAAAPAQEAPHSIGRFPVAGRLGSGGQADVFLSFHPELSVPVVVKWSHAPVPPGADGQGHLAREGQTLAGLGPHPNLLRVYELGLHEGRPFLVLEHVPGPTLDRYGQGERRDARRAAELVAALADAAQAAHEHGAVHQDINPSNVLIDGRGQPRLIDFGLAWVRSPWADAAAWERPDAGTPEYLSPEQADPAVGPVGPRADVFGLGAVLYYLLTGRALYGGATVRGVLRQAAAAAYDATALEREKVPKRLAAVCRKALARDPQGRYESAAVLAQALRASARRPRWPLLVALAALFLVTAAGGWLVGQLTRNGPGPVADFSNPALTVRVWRPKTEYVALGEALPVRTGDELQVRFRVPAGLHVGLFKVNGEGRLVLLEQYPPRDTPAELVYPAPDQTRELGPPPGTEVLLVCGRAAGPVSEAEVRDAWGSTGHWPALAPRRLLRLQAGRLREEGEAPRDFVGPARDRPESDAVVRRLDGLRERLAPKYLLFEGLAFHHE
jgi:hypothetical protein